MGELINGPWVQPTGWIDDSDEWALQALFYPQNCDATYKDAILLGSIPDSVADSAPSRDESHTVAIQERTVCTCPFCQWCRHHLLHV